MVTLCYLWELSHGLVSEVLGKSLVKLELLLKLKISFFEFPIGSYYQLSYGVMYTTL